MKFLSVGDLHGRPVWKKIKKYVNDFDKIVFVGDYMDSYTVSGNDALNNIVDIIDFKTQNPDKVILLWGNHDLPYYFWHTSIQDLVKCPGTKSSIMWKTNKLLIDNGDLFQAAYQYSNTIWSHAGISLNAYEAYYQKLHEYMNEFYFGEQSTHTIAEMLNRLFRERHPSVFHCGVERGGWKEFGGIFWADKVETEQAPLPDFNQVIGHTAVNDIVQLTINNNTLTYIDCLHNQETFYDVEIKG